MSKMMIGKRVPVDNLRTLWAKEPEFSDWLASAEGIELLAQDLEIQIENPIREAKGTNFPCDIVANMLGEEKHVVVIENQFGRTNHEHLAKLLTYAAVQKAMTGIWIAEEVADDHRQVIDWLNENTPDTVAFFLAELKAYTISGSTAAPQLDVICRPNVMMKRKISGFSESDQKRRTWRQNFWEDIHQRMKKINPPFRLQKPSGDHWSSISIGRAGFNIAMLLTPKNQSIAVEVYVQPEWKKEAFKQLQAEADAIHSELGRKLDWRAMPDKQSARILLVEKLDPGQESNHNAVCDWFTEWTPKIYLAFKERIKALVEPKDL
ncbi:MAG: hypothetical protein CVU52_01480 [Deltaproteobacteria bacterium HGW-Deltaproteobacteria-10]|nr:MAG: hypothetical protein CVU52_01480 [Deltaproteobacteria bacterium HGW-Deltaproteobacteria-10]